MDWKASLQGLLDSQPPSADSEPETAPENPQRTTIKLGNPKVSVERKGRGGKTATIIYDFACDNSVLPLVAAELKRRLATGGSVRDGEILIQGDCAERVRQLLKSITITL